MVFSSAIFLYWFLEYPLKDEEIKNAEISY